jgi:hypothetical protein
VSVRELDDPLLYQRWGTQGEEGRGVTLPMLPSEPNFLGAARCKTQVTKAGRVKSCSTNERNEG